MVKSYRIAAMVGLSLLLCAAASAGQARPPSAQEKANSRNKVIEKLVYQMADDLGLNDKQITKIRELHKEFLTTLDSLMEKQGEEDTNSILMRAKFRSIEQIRDERIVAALTAEQLRRYAEQLADESIQSDRMLKEMILPNLGLADDTAAKLDIELNKLIELRGETYAKDRITRGKLRDVLENHPDDARAIAGLLKEMRALEEQEEQINAHCQAIRKILTDAQYAWLILQGLVE